MRRGNLVRIAVLCAVVVVLAVAGATTALAHAGYSRSIPAADSRVARSPAAIEVWFTQELFRRAGANTLTVTAADGRRVDDGQPSISTDDRTLMSVALVEPLPPGAYRVTWQTLSAFDGDLADGSFDFTVDPSAPEPVSGGSGTPGTEPVETVSTFAAPEGSPWWIAIAVPAGLLSALLAVRAVRAPFEEPRT